MIPCLIWLTLLCSAHGQDVWDGRGDGSLNFTEVAVKYGGAAEEHDVTTEDGYVLKLFRVAGDAARPVLLVHGILDSSDGFIVRGARSLAVNLARAGHDVWAMNNRGNRYSRRHTTLDPDTDKAFWDFYVHEFGTQDLRAVMDFISSKTKAKISIIGYSEGATNALVLGATMPEYNDKVSVLIAMAPICYMHHAKPFMSYVIKLGPDFNKGQRMSGSEEFGGFYSPMKSFMNTLCNLKGIGYLLCVIGGVFTVSGADPESFEPEFVPIWIGHFPAGTSRKNMNHLSQIGNSKRFARYDYGPKKNLVMYGSETPPEYSLSKVSMKVALLVGNNDIVSTEQDVRLLRRQLPNVVHYQLMDYDAFNHIDFIWGKTTYTVVLPKVLKLLDKYSGT